MEFEDTQRILNSSSNVSFLYYWQCIISHVRAFVNKQPPLTQEQHAKIFLVLNSFIDAKIKVSYAFKEGLFYILEERFAEFISKLNEQSLKESFKQISADFNSGAVRSFGVALNDFSRYNFVDAAENLRRTALNLDVIYKRLYSLTEDKTSLFEQMSANEQSLFNDIVTGFHSLMRHVQFSSLALAVGVPLSDILSLVKHPGRQYGATKQYNDFKREGFIVFD